MRNGITHWYGVHVFYYDQNSDDLILDCLRPLHRRLASLVERSFFVRHWLRGPHVRLRIQAEPERYAGEIRPLVNEAVGEYLRARPSRATVDEERMAPTYKQLAELEREEGPLFPLYSNNSIQHLPYERRVDIIGSEALAELIECFYVDTSESVFQILDEVRNGADRLVLALDLMLATAHAQGDGISRGFLSFRSHAEAFIMRAPEPESMRVALDERYALRRDALVERARQVVTYLDAGVGDVPFVAGWLDLLRALRERAEPLIRSGELPLGPSRADESFEYGPALKATLGHSAFHRRIAEDPEYRRVLYGDPWFQRFRLMVNLLYLHLNRLGVRPIERFMLCHLAARAVEDAFGVSADELMSWRPPHAGNPPTGAG